jgi:hypothetical protein
VEEQAMLPLKALMRKTESRCHLLTWRERKFNLRRVHIKKGLNAVKESGVT